MNKNPKAALYIRVSTREQALDGFSLAAQERVLTEYCQQKNYDISEIYRDEGISGKNIKNRPALLRLLEDSKAGKFDIVLVWKLTRFSRNMADTVNMCETLDKYGVTLISCSEAFDSATPAGRLIRAMLSAVAQFEREVTIENTKIAQHERARQGKRTCSDVLGYDLAGKDSLKINHPEAKYVHFVFDDFLKCKSLSKVADHARLKGYHGKRGGIPKPESIRKILTRPIYCGYYSFHNELYKGNFTPIISIVQYNRVQLLLKRQGKLTGRTLKNKYITINK